MIWQTAISSRSSRTTRAFGCSTRLCRLGPSLFLARSRTRRRPSDRIASLNDLADCHQFQIISYNEGVRVFNPFMPLGPKPVFGTQQNKEAAVRSDRQPE